MKKHLVVDLSAHGFGHIAQTAAMLNCLPDDKYRITLRSIAEESVLRRRIAKPFDLIRYQQDMGMKMHNAMQVDVTASFEWYQQFHHNFESRVEQAAHDLYQLKPDLVFANVPYLSLEAASRIDCRSLAMCSLNWDDIFYDYCLSIDGALEIHQQIESAYQKAEYFLQPTPSMPMENLKNRRQINTIASQGKNRKDEVLYHLKKPAGTKMVLISLGGIGMHYPIDAWPRLDNVIWIFPKGSFDTAQLNRDDLYSEEQIALAYIDLIASCDALITKTGYGTQTEAVLHQKPALVLNRPDWPEQPPLFEWHQNHGVFAECQWQDIESGKMADIIEPLLESDWYFDPVPANGDQQASQIIEELLNG